MISGTSSPSINLTVDHIIMAIRRMLPRPTEIRVSKALTQQFQFPPAGMPVRMARAWRKRADCFRPLPYALKDTLRNVIYIHPDALAAIEAR